MALGKDARYVSREFSHLAGCISRSRLNQRAGLNMSVELSGLEAGGRDFPERLGRYRLVRRISRGGMAQVYEARRESLAGVAPREALKGILPEHAEDENFRDLFINEARVGSQLQHPNLVQIQDFDQQGDLYYLVMEYVEGVTLRRMLSLSKRNGLALSQAVIAEMGRQLCEGLHYAHTARAEDGTPRHLVHRDIKPASPLPAPPSSFQSSLTRTTLQTSS